MCSELQQVGWTSYSKSGLDGKTDDATHTARKYESLSLTKYGVLERTEQAPKQVQKWLQRTEGFLSVREWG